MLSLRSRSNHRRFNDLQLRSSAAEGLGTEEVGAKNLDKYGCSLYSLFIVAQLGPIVVQAWCPSGWESRQTSALS